MIRVKLPFDRHVPPVVPDLAMTDNQTLEFEIERLVAGGVFGGERV